MKFWETHKLIARSTLEGLYGQVVCNDACDTSGAKFKPHISEIAFPQPKEFREESCFSDNWTPEKQHWQIVSSKL